MAHKTRRFVLSLALAGALAPRLGARAAEARGLDSAEELFQAYRKLRFALHDRPLFWWIRATKYGLFEDVLTPLYGMEIASIFQTVPRPNNRFAARSLEIVYSTDLETGELLDEWTNPYTGTTVPVSHVPVGPNVLEYDLDGPRLPTELPGARLESENVFGEAWAHNGGFWMRDDNAAVVTQLDGKGQPFRVYDWATYHADLEEVLDAGVYSVAATVSFQAVSTWQRWMGMGSRPGNLVSRGSGQKVSRYEELPPRFRRLFESQHPELAADPAGALDRDAYRFER